MLVGVDTRIQWLVGGGGCVLLSFVYVFDMSPLGSMMYLFEGLYQTLYDWLGMISDLDAYVCVFPIFILLLTIVVQGVILCGKANKYSIGC